MSNTAKMRSATGKTVKLRRPGNATGAGSRGTQPAEVVGTLGSGKSWHARRGAGAATKARPYPVQACSTRWKDPESGQFVPRPKDAPEQTRKGRTSAPVTVRAVTTHGDGSREVTGVKTVLGAFRRGQEKGQLSKKDVRQIERETARETLAELNPRLAASLDSEAMHEAHRSDKSKRGAATRKKNAAKGIGKKKRSAAVIQTELLRVEHLVRDAQRRHSSAKTSKSRQAHAESIRTRRARLDKLRRELRAVQGA